MNKSKSEQKVGLLQELKDKDTKLWNNRSSQKLLDISAGSPNRSTN